MMQNFRNEVQQFLTSEVGQATIRGPLALGVASGALLLSQGLHTSSAQIDCVGDADCSSGQVCKWKCNVWSNGTCKSWESRCISSDS